MIPEHFWNVQLHHSHLTTNFHLDKNKSLFLHNEGKVIGQAVRFFCSTPQRSLRHSDIHQFRTFLIILYLTPNSVSLTSPQM